MYKIEKFKYEDRHNHFWSSDFHNYHDPAWDVPIWKMRGYSSFEESFNDIRDKINAKVGVNQHLWMLGDSFLSCTDDQVIEWWDSINCNNIHLLWGNHESQMYRIYKQCVKRVYNLDDVEVYPLKMGNVIFSGNHLEISIGKVRFVMNHFPQHTHNHAARGSVSIHGHCHRNDPTREPHHPLNKTLDVSWDKKLDVWSYDEIMDVMSTKEIYVPDHH